MSLSRRLGVGAFCVGLTLAGAGCGSASPYAATVSFAKTSTAGGATSESTTSTTAAGDAPQGAVPEGETTSSTAAVDYGDTVKIDRSEFERELEALNDNQQLQAASGGDGLSGEGKKTINPRLAAGWLTSIIYDKLIAHEFERRRLQITPADTEFARAQLETQFGSAAVATAFPKWFQDRVIERNARALAVRSAVSGFDFSEGSLQKYFEAHKAEFGQNCLSHILVRSKAEADAALARLKAGADFAAVARDVSVDTGSGSKGGDLGCNPKGVFVPEFDQAASQLPIGQLSDPVRTQYGFHILRVQERKEATFETVREEVRAKVNAETQEAFRQFLKSAVRLIKVTVDKRYGTFEPSGTGQAPEVIPPSVPKPKSERTDNVPTTQPLGGVPPDSPGTAEQPVG